MQDFTIGAHWGPRPEEPDQIALRIRALLAELRPITPEFERWYQVIADDNMPELDDSETWLASVVAADVCTGDLGEPLPLLGYFSRTTNDPVVFSQRVGGVTIMIEAGSHRMFNGVTLRSSSERDLPPSLLAYPVVKRTVLALSHTFESSWSSAGPYCLCEGMVMSRYKQGPIITPCWMIHLSSPLAQRITPPSDVVSERLDDGSLFLSVTDEPFSPDNPAHVDGARRLFAILDTLQEKKPREQWRF